MSGKGESMRELVQLQKKMNQLFEEMLQPGRPHEALPEYRWVPAADVYEDRRHYFVELEVPGVQIDDVDLTCEGNNLRVAGERKPVMELTRESVHRMERYIGPFGREFTFPEPLDPSKVEAHMEAGVLSVKIPKRHHRSIKVK